MIKHRVWFLIAVFVLPLLFTTVPVFDSFKITQPATVHAQPAPDPDGAPDDAGADDKTCEDVSGWEMGWVVCPIFRMISFVIDGGIEFIVDQMDFGDHHRSPEVENTWQGFRNLARVFYTVGLAFVIYAIATGSLLSAFDARKMAQNLFIAILTVELSFAGLTFMIDISNDLGQDMNAFILQTGGAENGENFGLYSESGEGPGEEIVNTVIGAAANLAVGLIAVIIGIVALLYLGFAMLVLWLIVLLRNLVVISLLIVSPLALVLRVIPFIESLTKRWWQGMSLATFLYPFLTGGIAMGAVVGKVVFASSGDGLGKLVSTTSASAVKFTSPLATAWLAQTVFRGAGRITGFVSQNSRRFSPVRRIFGSQWYSDFRRNAGVGGHSWASTELPDGTSKMNWRGKAAMAISNPYGIINPTSGMDPDEYKAYMKNATRRQKIRAYIGNRGDARANLSYGDLLNERVEELERREILKKDYRLSEAVMTGWGLANKGDSTLLDNLLSDLYANDKARYANAITNLDYLNSGKPENVIAYTYALARMGKTTFEGESFGVHGFDNLADPNRDPENGVGGKLIVGKGNTSFDILTDYLHDQGYSAGMVGAINQEISGAAYNAGQQPRKYASVLEVFDEDGRLTGLKTDFDYLKSAEKATVKAWGGNPASVNQFAGDLGTVISKGYASYMDEVSKSGRDSVASQTKRTKLMSYMTTFAGASNYYGQFEPKNRVKVEDVMRDIASLTANHPNADNIAGSEDDIKKFILVGMQQARAQSYADLDATPLEILAKRMTGIDPTRLTEDISEINPMGFG